MGILKLFLKLAVVGLFILILLMFLGQLIFEKVHKFPAKIHYGVTFSPQYAKYLELDYQKVFISILDKLEIKDLRIPAYWSIIEEKQHKFDFSEVDFMVDEIGKRKGKTLLVVGLRQPRWPECYPPDWVKELTKDEKRAKILGLIRETVNRYKNNPVIWAYQVENEPFLPFFGQNCDLPDANFLRKEVDLVRSLTSKPIVISDSGELGSWIVPMQVSDIFGTTLYRDVYNPLMGYLTYPILPYLYNLKSQIVKGIFAPQNQKTIIVELQAEPWIGKPAQFFPVEKLKSYINYAQKTGFDIQYLWGVEWWYWMAEHGHSEYLEYAKTLFK